MTECTPNTDLVVEWTVQRWWNSMAAASGSDWLLISNVTNLFPIDDGRKQQPKIIIGNSDRSQIPFQRTDNNLQLTQRSGVNPLPLSASRAPTCPTFTSQKFGDEH